MNNFPYIFSVMCCKKISLWGFWVRSESCAFHITVGRVRTNIPSFSTYTNRDAHYKKNVQRTNHNNWSLIKSISINQYKVNKVRHNKVAANIGSPQGAMLSPTIFLSILVVIKLNIVSSLMKQETR